MPVCLTGPFFQVVELKPGGKDIPVSTANRIAYIHLVADYRLNKQIRPHCLAFRQGLANVVNLEWLRMFDQQEIQVTWIFTRLAKFRQLSQNFQDYWKVSEFGGNCLNFATLFTLLTNMHT